MGVSHLVRADGRGLDPCPVCGYPKTSFFVLFFRAVVLFVFGSGEGWVSEVVGQSVGSLA